MATNSKFNDASNHSGASTPVLTKYFKLPNPGLRAYFQHVEQGNDEEYRTTFYRDKSLGEILLAWSKILEPGIREWPSLVNFENDLRGKVGPMSVMLPLSQRIGDIESYYESVLLDSTPIDDRAISATIDWFKQLKGLRLRSVNRTIDLMKKSTNSGQPFFTKRRLVTNKTIPFTLEGSETRYPGGNSYANAAILGWRGQEGGPSKEDVKQRVVWMFPYAINIAELQLYQPLIESCQKFNLVPAWVSMDAVDQEITKLFDTKSRDDLVVCTDFSKFDQHFNKDMQQCASDILAQLLTTSNETSHWLKEVFPVKYNIPLIASESTMFTGPHGMGSGSGGTNADETLTHRALQYEAAILAGKTLNPHSMCLGDDGILSYPGITVDDVVSAYSAHGQEMNTDKQYASKHDCVYLRRWHHDAYRVNGICVGVYSTYRALGRLAEQERYYDPEVWSKEMVALRQLSILENVKYHPLKEKFVQFCMKGDKYRLGLDIPGFLSSIDSWAEKATAHMPDFLGYTKSMQSDPDCKSKNNSGISEWWIVQYLKSLV